MMQLRLAGPCNVYQYSSLTLTSRNEIRYAPAAWRLFELSRCMHALLGAPLHYGHLYAVPIVVMCVVACACATLRVPLHLSANAQVRQSAGGK
jgi:hypothetical protein